MARLLRKEEISFSARPRGWRLSLERNKALDPGQISFFSRKAVMPKAQTLAHLLEQFGLAGPRLASYNVQHGCVLSENGQ